MVRSPPCKRSWALSMVLPLLPAAAPRSSAVSEDDTCSGALVGRGPSCEVQLLQHAAQRREAPGQTMRAVVFSGLFGLAKTVHQELRPIPKPGAGQALVEIQASSVNPIDWKMMAFSNGVLGRDFAGVNRVSQGCNFEEGDDVWGDNNYANGAFAEYMVVDCKYMGLRPKSLKAFEAGALPHVGLTGLQALTQAGAPWTTPSMVLVLGGSGGCGHVGVQLAKAMGAGKVISTNSPANDEMVKSAGADLTIDYNVENWEEVLHRVDVIYDTVGEPGTGEKAFKILKTGGVFVTLHADALASPKTESEHPGVSQRHCIMSEFSRDKLDILKDFVDQGKLKPVVASLYELEEVQEAIEVSKGGHAGGKIAISVRHLPAKSK